jgi:hypothetical protein
LINRGNDSDIISGNTADTAGFLFYFTAILGAQDVEKGIFKSDHFAAPGFCYWPCSWKRISQPLGLDPTRSGLLRLLLAKVKGILQHYVQQLGNRIEIPRDL